MKHLSKLDKNYPNLIYLAKKVPGTMKMPGTFHFLNFAKVPNLRKIYAC